MYRNGYSKEIEKLMEQRLYSPVKLIGSPNVFLTMPLFWPGNSRTNLELRTKHSSDLAQLTKEVINRVDRCLHARHHKKDDLDKCTYLMRIETRDRHGGYVHPHLHCFFWLTLQQMNKLWKRREWLEEALAKLCSQLNFREDIYLIPFSNGYARYILKYPLDDVLLIKSRNILGFENSPHTNEQ